MIPLFHVAMDFDFARLDDTLSSGYIGEGPRVKEFEAALVPFIGRKPAAVSSCTMALTIALRLCGVESGDDVITTPMTCSATNLPILALGARPIWADIDPRTGLIDPDSVKRLVTMRTKAIIAVDWGGQPCEYDALTGRVPLIVDAAHSIGATYKGKLATEYADFVAYSFQAIKHLTTGDGGALASKSEVQDSRSRFLRWFGIDRDAPVEFKGALDIVEPGYKGNMNDIAATIGLGNLEGLAARLEGHRLNAEYLERILDSRFTSTRPVYEHQGSWWMYTTLLRSKRDRDCFLEHAKYVGLAASQVHWRNDKLTAFRHYARALPGVTEFADRMVCLPTWDGVDITAVARLANEYPA